MKCFHMSRSSSSSSSSFFQFFTFSFVVFICKYIIIINNIEGGSGGESYDGGDGGVESSLKPDRRHHTRPWYYLVDRQVAAVELRNHTRGVYVCANGGNCSAPDTCRCAAGWSGFDCRTPICEQGYYVADQERFVAGTLLIDEVKNFDDFMEPRLKDQRLSYAYLTNESTAHYGTDPNDNILGLHPMWEYSNPNYTKVRVSQQSPYCIHVVHMSLFSVFAFFFFSALLTIVYL